MNNMSNRHSDIISKLIDQNSERQCSQMLIYNTTSFKAGTEAIRRRNDGIASFFSRKYIRVEKSLFCLSNFSRKFSYYFQVILPELLN